MKLLVDLKSIEDVGTTLVQCFVQENVLTESAARLMVSRATLLTETYDESRFPILESVGGQNIKMEPIEVNGVKYPYTLYDLIVAYVEYDDFPDPVDMMSALGIPKGEWAQYPDPELVARNRLTRTIFKNALKYDEGRKWISPKWSDRARYSKASANSIHPSKVGFEHGINATPTTGDSIGGDEHWDEATMVDSGSRGRKTRSSRTIDAFNKSEIATGEFYNNISRIRPSVWGRIWNREKTSVQSDRARFGIKWKKIFVLGYQVDRNLLYEIWYGTYDSMFSVHDHRGNQISRKFPTVSEATKSLTRAIVQTGDDDAQIFNHGGDAPNRIAASLMKTISNDSDSMVTDLMKIEQREVEKREKIEQKRLNRAMDDHKEWESTKKYLKQTAVSMAKAGASATGAAIKRDIKSTKGEFKAIISNLNRAGTISKDIAAYLEKHMRAASIMTSIHIDAAAREFNINRNTSDQWKRDLAAGKMDLETFAIKLEMERDAAERSSVSMDEMNLNKLKSHSVWSRNPKVEGNDSDARETKYRPTTVKKHLGYKGVSTRDAEQDILNSGIPSYASTVGSDINKIRAYVVTLLNDRTYSEGRSQKDEIRLITLDVYGDIRYLGTVSSMVKRLKDNGTVIRESSEYDENDRLFDIQDELDGRRDSTVGTMRRNSAKIGMTISDFKDAINSDMIQFYDDTRISESMWKSKFTRILNAGRRVPIALPTDKPSVAQRVRMFFQGTRYRADFVTGVTLNDRINVEVWYVTEPNPNAGIFDNRGVIDSDYHGRSSITSFYVFDVTSGSLVRKYLPYHKNAIQVALGKLGAI